LLVSHTTNSTHDYYFDGARGANMEVQAPRLRLRLRSYVVIPARLASSRLPRKLLLRETGQSLIQHTYDAASRATRPLDVIVAAGDEEIAAEVRGFGGRVEMTDPQAPSGTDRVAEVARDLTNADVLVNVQGDEPEISGDAIDVAIDLLERNPQAVMSTLAAPIRDRAALHDPACVKVVFDDAQRALYFSRSPIPHAREWNDELLEADPPCFYQHIGLYAYRSSFLLQLSTLPPSRLEKLEKLEQLRVLSAGHDILVGVIDKPTGGIDTPEDYRAFVSRTVTC
jgi:3-deoxy-manno-octulosonate cytidylyltransferase (CMP-KDO synthetase)